MDRKRYIVYVDGYERLMIRARSHNEAEKKARAFYPNHDPFRISVACIEI